MKVEILVYIYLFVCVALILFNITTMIVMRRRVKTDEKNTAKYRELIGREISRLSSGEKVDKKHTAMLSKKMKRPEHLRLFINTVSEMYDEGSEAVRAYLDSIAKIFYSLTPAYTKGGDEMIEYAFFLYVLKVFCEMRGFTPKRIAHVMTGALTVSNTYVRENALRGIYSSGDVGYVTDALKALDTANIPHNVKLLTDGLLTFKGDLNELRGKLWEIYDGCGLRIKEVILDFMRFGDSEDSDRMLEIMSDPTADDELRFCCIRYFGRHPSEKAFPYIIAFAENKDDKRWEYPSIASSILVAYPCEETVTVLKNNLFVSNWYIRYNSAESLRKLKVDYFDVIDIVNGNDRYAREMMQYEMDLMYNRKLEEEEREEEL